MRVLYIVVYVLFSFGALACIVRAARYARLPLNLRWELYPIPHEPGRRAAYGGSYFEDSDGQVKGAKPNMAGDLKAMLLEIMFFRALYRHNRSLWIWSYPFHVGLYLLIATGAAAIGAAAASISVPHLSTVGMCGCLLSMIGAAGLFVRRVKDAGLRMYSVAADYFNLLFFFLVAALLTATGLRPSHAGLVDIAKALLTFDTTLELSALQIIGMILLALLTAYIPTTHMAHFIGKYFTYHAIRWGDRPRGTEPIVERTVADYLSYQPTWSAAHMGAGDGATWANVATGDSGVEKTK